MKLGRKSISSDLYSFLFFVQLPDITIRKRISTQKVVVQHLSNFSKPITKSVIQLIQLYFIIYRVVMNEYGLSSSLKIRKSSCFSWIKAAYNEFSKLD